MKTFFNLSSQSIQSCFLNLFNLSSQSCLLNLVFSILFSQSFQSCLINLFNLSFQSFLTLTSFLNLKYNHSLVCLYIVVDVSSVYIYWFQVSRLFKRVQKVYCSTFTADCSLFTVKKNSLSFNSHTW